MAKIRHLAYRAEDPEGMAKFFIEGFGMTIAQRRGHGVIDLTDGTINLTVLPAVNGDPFRALYFAFFPESREGAKKIAVFVIPGNPTST